MVLCLGEVFRVIYKGRHEVKPEEQLGTINIQCPNVNYNEYLYKVEDVDMGRPTIKPGDSVILTSPTGGSFHCHMPLMINVDLFNGAYKGTLYHGDISKSGAPLEKRILSEDGTGEICVLYSLFYNATEAQVEVMLSDDAAAVAADSCGVVAASISKIDRPGFSSLLFLKEFGRSINMGDNCKKITLLRSTVAVPLGSHLFIDIHMSSINYGTIFNGSLVFNVQSDTTCLDTTCLQSLVGQKGIIHVKVIWKNVPMAKEGNYVPSSPDASEVSENEAHYMSSSEEERP